MAFDYKLFDIYTKKYILLNPEDPDSVLTETVENSMFDVLLPEDAKSKLSLADIEQGMTGEMIEENHPDPENNVLLINKGSKGVYGPPEYKEILEKYFNLKKDTAYTRYFGNGNEKLETEKSLKIWVIEDEEGKVWY